MKIKRRAVFWLTGAVIVIAAVSLALRPRPMLVEVATIGSGRLETTIPAEGRTRIH
ncbi:MAG: hypothetical protein RIR52_1640, partial [Acidobacteriota bacterium]